MASAQGHPGAGRPQRFAASPLLWLGAVSIAVGIAAIVAPIGSYTSNERQIVTILFGIGGLLLIHAAWSHTHPEPQPTDRIRFESWWIPRSLRVRALLAIGVPGVIALVASEAHSFLDAVLAAALYTMLLGINASMGHDGNYVELRPVGIYVSKVASTGRSSVTAGSELSYSDVDSVRVKKSGDFQLSYLDKGRRDKVKKVTFKIVPERRREFLDDLLARLRQARAEGVTVTFDRELQ